VILKLPVTYSPDRTDAESVACAIDYLLVTALSTPGILDEYGNPEVDETSYDLDDDQPVFDLPMSQEDYVATEGKRCPYCGSDDLDRSEVVSENARPAEAKADEECNKCRRMWKSTWRMTGYTDDESSASEAVADHDEEQDAPNRYDHDDDEEGDEEDDEEDVSDYFDRYDKEDK
jgi:uncharacterized Zn finger protein (UPF0148 family)